MIRHNTFGRSIVVAVFALACAVMPAGGRALQVQWQAGVCTGGNGNVTTTRAMFSGANDGGRLSFALATPDRRRLETLRTIVKGAVAALNRRDFSDTASLLRWTAPTPELRDQHSFVASYEAMPNGAAVRFVTASAAKRAALSYWFRLVVTGNATATAIFSRRKNQLLIRTASCTDHPFPASNHPDHPENDPFKHEANGLWPNGTWSMEGYVDRSAADGEDDQYGTVGIERVNDTYRDLVGRYLGLHGGRLRHHPPGWRYFTHGCIRTTDEAMRFLVTHPVKSITVGDA